MQFKQNTTLNDLICMLTLTLHPCLGLATGLCLFFLQQELLLISYLAKLIAYLVRFYHLDFTF